MIRIKGQVIPQGVCEIIPILRGDTTIILKAAPVVDYEPFEAICPQPQPKWIHRPGQAPAQDFENPEYKKALDEWIERRSAWMIIQSLSATEGLEWGKVDLSDPSTFKNYMDDLRDSGFTEAELSRVISGVTIACGLDQKKVEEARNSFLASPDRPSMYVRSRVSEQSSTQSGEPVKEQA